jgi:hypothetical protein
MQYNQYQSSIEIYKKNTKYKIPKIHRMYTTMHAARKRKIQEKAKLMGANTLYTNCRQELVRIQLRSGPLAGNNAT